MVDPGTIIAVVTVAYTGAIKAWSTFQSALNFDDDAANLVLQLEFEKFRLQTWALNVGLTTGTFDTKLHPIHELIAERLNRITKLFEEAEKIKEKYGIVVSEASKIRPERIHGIMSGMALSIRSMGIKLDIEEKPKQPESDKIPNRIRWALSSKSKFSKLVSALEEYIGKLDALLTETQRRSVKDDWKQINIILAGDIPAEQVELVQQALSPVTGHQPSKSTIEIVKLVRRKAIHTSIPAQTQGRAHSLERRDLGEFVLPADISGQSRVLAAATPQIQSILGTGPFMLERKQYDANISIQDKRQLKRRLDRLILLLSSTKSEDFRTFRAVGYCDDPGSFSWWLIFQCPFSIGSAEPTKRQVICLRDKFSLKNKPTLEDRFSLASMLSKTFAELLNSGWMHKNLRSENVLFPQAWDKEMVGKNERILGISPSPYLAGFEYSRPDTEAVTIDKGRHLRDIESAIYRHPDYQGEAASGYRMKYDIYSFGLVMVEIALWTPLLTFLDAKGGPSTSVQLSSKMKTFHREEALELKKRVLGRVDGELGFRVGSRFRDAVRWCLTMSESEEDEEWHPALEFHRYVVTSLERCAALRE